MAPNPERRRHSRTKSFSGQRDLTIICQPGAGRSMMAARLLDFSEDGMGVEVESPLEEGSLVEIVDDIQRAGGRQPLRAELTLRRVLEANDLPQVSPG